MSRNRTPAQWRTDTSWKYGPRKVVLTGERPDPLQLPETAGDDGPPSRRRSVSSHDVALLVGCTLLLAGLYLFADWLVRL